MLPGTGGVRIPPKPVALGAKAEDVRMVVPIDLRSRSSAADTRVDSQRALR